MNKIFDTFDSPVEKGRGEWNTFNAVAHDKTTLQHAFSPAQKRRSVPRVIRFGASRLLVLKGAG